MPTINTASGKLNPSKSSKVIPLKKYDKRKNAPVRDGGYQTANQLSASGDTTPINGIPSNGRTGMYMQIKSKDSSNYYDTAALKSNSFKTADNNFSDLVNA